MRRNCQSRVSITASESTYPPSVWWIAHTDKGRLHPETLRLTSALSNSLQSRLCLRHEVLESWTVPLSSVPILRPPHMCRMVSLVISSSSHQYRYTLAATGYIQVLPSKPGG